AAELRPGGRPIAAASLRASARDGRRRGRARRLALEVVERLRPGTRQRLLPGWLDDPEFRYDAVEQRLAALERDKETPRERAVAAYREVFEAARDLEQARRVANRRKALRARGSVAAHPGTLRGR